MHVVVRTGRRALVPLAGAAVLLSGLPSTATGATPRNPDYEMPFPCGDTWNGSSRYNHSPSAWAIDWNGDRDLGAIMVAAAPGVVTSVVNLGDRSYGRYVVVDHGRGRTSLYAHLSAFWATQGQAVDQGTPLGLVGSSGGSSGPHLHFEERTNKSDHRAYFHRRSFVMGTTAASRNCGDMPVVGDWDRNGTTNVGVRRLSTSPRFALRRPGKAALSIRYGWRTDQPLSGDWDGDGTSEIGSRRPGLAAFVLRNRNGSIRKIPMGRISDVGVTGDWNGDRRTDVGVWRPRTRVFTLRAANGSTRTVTLGSLGDRPITGDWNGDGRTDLGVYSARTSTFRLRSVARNGAVNFTTVAWGLPTSLPVSGDWDGDGIGDIGMWNPSTAVFSLRLSPHGSRTTGVKRLVPWGLTRG